MLKWVQLSNYRAINVCFGFIIQYLVCFHANIVLYELYYYVFLCFHVPLIVSESIPGRSPEEPEGPGVARGL